VIEMKEIILFAIKLCMVAALLVALYTPIKSSIRKDRIYEAALLWCVEDGSFVRDPYSQRLNAGERAFILWGSCREWVDTYAEYGFEIGHPVEEIHADMRKQLGLPPKD